MHPYFHPFKEKWRRIVQARHAPETPQRRALFAFEGGVEATREPSRRN